MPKQKLSRRERLIEDRKRLEQESKRLRNEVAVREKRIAETQEQVQQVRGDASVEVQRIQSEYGTIQLNAEEIREQAIHDLFKDILAGPAQISLIRLLTMGDDDTDQRWLLPLAYYLKEQVGLSLIGEKDAIITLTDDNCDAYSVDEQVSLPCEARISKRGFAIGQTVIQRPEVTTQLEG